MAQWQRICLPMQETQVRSLGQEDSPWRKKGQPSPVFLPGKSHGQRSLAGYSPWGHKKLRHNLTTKQQQKTTEMLPHSSHAHIHSEEVPCSQRLGLGLLWN